MAWGRQPRIEVRIVGAYPRVRPIIIKKVLGTMIKQPNTQFCPFNRNIV